MMEDIIIVSLSLRIGELTLGIDKALPAHEWRDHPMAALEARLQEMLVQALPPAITAFDARQKLRADRA